MPLSRPRFHDLPITDLRRETEDAVSIAFAVPDELRIAYAFQPGQYLTIEADVRGIITRRAYSICSIPEDGELRIAARAIEDGAMSHYLNRHAVPGDRLAVMTPTGRFGRLPAAAGPRRIAAFAAGSGITPIIGIIRNLLTHEAETSVFLAYGNRMAASILFRDVLAALKDRYANRFSLLHVLSREAQDIQLLNGRIDRGKAAILLARMVGPVDHLLICGPEAMIGAVTAAGLDHGVPDKAIHAERFVSAHGGVPRPAPMTVEAPGIRVTIIADGKRVDIGVAPGEAVLDAALRAGLDLPYACKGGMCSTCRAKLTGGSARMAVNYALEPWEIAAGFVLTCQARPEADGAIFDYDAV